jgi:hypothetical protein
MCGDKNVFRAMALANTPCPITDLDTGRLLIGRDAFEKYRDNPEIFIVGYSEDQNFWIQLLKIGEKLDELPQNENSISLSDRFRRNGRSDNDRSVTSGKDNNGTGEAVEDTGGGR